MSGISISIRKIAMTDAGIVIAHFQLASHLRCMKNKMTSSALPQETSIIRIRDILDPNGHQLTCVKKDNVVNTQRLTNTAQYVAALPWCS